MSTENPVEQHATQSSVVLKNFSFLSQNECSFVSLRDVERAMKVIMWFYSNSKLIDEVIKNEDTSRDEDSCRRISREDSFETTSDDEYDFKAISEDKNDDSDDELCLMEQVRTLKILLLTVMLLHNLGKNISFSSLW